jgi:hypothetical protein
MTERDDPDSEQYALHSELGGEAKRLVTHPVHEAERLAEEMREGEADTTPGIVIGVVGLVVAVVVLSVLGIAGIAYLLTR